MEWYADSHDSLQYISIFSSEIQVIAGLAAQWGSVETGGEFYGLWSHAGRPVVMLATPPGPEAIHETARFRQDVEYFMRMTEEITSRFGIQFIGDYHSHHFLGIDHPSRGDAAHVQAVTAKNHLPRIIQVILTNEGTSPIGLRFSERELIEEGSSSDYHDHPPQRAIWNRAKVWGRTLWPIKRLVSVERVIVNSFFYPNARLGQWIRCPVKVIPGMSPIRKAFPWDELSLDEDPALFLPLERIDHEEVGLPEKDNTQGCKIPDRVMRQVLELPEEIREEVSAVTGDGFLLLHLPLYDGSKGSVALNDDWPYPVKAVFLHDGEGESIDVTKEVLHYGRSTRISNIYIGLLSLLEQDGREDPGRETVKGDPTPAVTVTGERNSEGSASSEVKEDNYCDESGKGA
jgi:hypothetical protein